ncbi:MAG: cyclopropane-fatty-acyl-phospholipid synthase family protein [Pseudomonadota bacterium]
MTELADHQDVTASDDPSAIVILGATINQQLRNELAGLPPAAAQALRFVCHITHGSLEIRLPDGRRVKVESGTEGPAAELYIHDYGFFPRLFKDADLGVAEAYLDGQWSSPDPTSFLQLFAVNFDAYDAFLKRHKVLNLLNRLRHFFNRNTRSGARRNISAHYDMGNDFFAAWLDPTMTYSSAYFAEGANDLPTAQTAKYRAIANSLGLSDRHSVLEIGCGWGGFAEFAARDIGCNVVGLTISKEQYDFTKKRLFDAGLTEKVDVRLRDYRDETDSFDRIVSIEMIEAVGEKYWPTYFAALRDRLVEGGRAGIQAITIRQDMFDTYRRSPDFIQRHIFPGGMLPTRDILSDLGAHTGLPLVSERAFGLDYARTLEQWRERFEAAWPTLTPLGFDERFRRLWTYYLHYCEAGFRGGSIDVHQFCFAKST